MTPPAPPTARPVNTTATGRTRTPLSELALVSRFGHGGSECSTEMSVAYSEINAAVNRLQLRDRADGVRDSSHKLAAKSPEEEVLFMMADQPAVAVGEEADDGQYDDDEVVRPQQLRFEDAATTATAAPGSAVAPDESDDEVAMEDLAMLASTPLGATRPEAAFWRTTGSGGSLTPLTEVLALMASPSTLMED